LGLNLPKDVLNEHQSFLAAQSYTTLLKGMQNTNQTTGPLNPTTKVETSTAPAH
jgi:hypothetical protein